MSNCIPCLNFFINKSFRSKSFGSIIFNKEAYCSALLIKGVAVKEATLSIREVIALKTNILSLS